MSKHKIKEIIRQLKKNEIRVIDIPEEYENDLQIVTYERKAGLRITGKRGFDIISDSFFVEEELIYSRMNNEEHRMPTCSTFDSFEEFYSFLNGDIYENACYTFHHIPEDELKLRNVDEKKLSERKSFIEETISDYSLSISSEEKEEFQKAKTIHRQCKQWCKRFNSCTSYGELAKVTRNYGKSKLASTVDVIFFFFNYIFADIEDRNRFSVIMEYMSSESYPEYQLIKALCSIYNPEDVIQSFIRPAGGSSSFYKEKRRLKDFVQLLSTGEIEFFTQAYFDKTTQYYCEETLGYEKNRNRKPVSTIRRYFASFEEFVRYRNGDLTHCDLSSALELAADFSGYRVDQTTKLPAHADENAIYTVKKHYHKGTFYVSQQWHDASKCVIKEYNHSFLRFFDFVAFLQGDLSGADLLSCDGLMNLREWGDIDFSGAKMTSDLCQKFGLRYDTYEIKTDLIKSFVCTEQNETESVLALQATRDLIAESQQLDIEIEADYKCQKVSYISDIHLMHRVISRQCRSEEDIKHLVQEIADSIAHETGRLLLIDGDVSSDFSVFQLFVKALSQTLPKNTLAVFTLGNHELWSFPGLTLDEIVRKYREVLDEYGMYLLQNDILYREDSKYFDGARKGTYLIKYEELCRLDDAQIVDRLRSARYVILGGQGFSGYNTAFNADNGIYRGTIDRAEEIQETLKFEALYNRLYGILSTKNTVVLTHTPKSDWCKDAEPQENLVYVSGHTHRNYYYDDGEHRIYADNQIGYHNDHVHVKTFLIDNEYDCFSDYPDGIYQITGEQYNDFYKGKNLEMTFHREVNILYMLKKHGYFCFIHESKEGGLCILNGGMMNRIGAKDIQYYFDSMDKMIDRIKTPLDKFTAVQKSIADTVKRIGGEGRIHGCIIDIDYYNHIYVNPIDLTITGYWAANITYKIAYPSVPALLKEKCPEMYKRYMKQLKGSKADALAVRQQTEIMSKPRLYLDTDIYKASRAIKRMQKLSSNILCSWYEIPTNGQPLIALT